MTPHQTEVLTVMKRYGPMPDATLVPLVQSLSSIRITDSSARSRRHELAQQGKVIACGHVKLPTGRTAVMWQAKP